MAVWLLQSFTVTVRMIGDLSVTCQEVNDYPAKKRHVRFRSVFKNIIIKRRDANMWLKPWRNAAVEIQPLTLNYAWVSKENLTREEWRSTTCKNWRLNAAARQSTWRTIDDTSWQSVHTTKYRASFIVVKFVFDQTCLWKWGGGLQMSFLQLYNANKISGPKGSIKINDHFTCTSSNVIA